MLLFLPRISKYISAICQQSANKPASVLSVHIPIFAAGIKHP